MINLIINEFKKLFSKKSTYIILLVLIIILVGINYLNKSTSVYESNEYGIYEEDYISKSEMIMNDIEEQGFPDMLNNEENWRMYKYDIEQNKFAKRLRDNGPGQGWKVRYIYPGSDVIQSQSEFIELELEIAKGNKEIAETKRYKDVKKQYEKELDDYTRMTEEEFTAKRYKEEEEAIKQGNIHLASLKIEAEKVEDNRIFLQQIADIESNVKHAEHNIEILNIRKEKNIPYSLDNYMNQALDEYDRLTESFDINDKPGDDANDSDKSNYYENSKWLNEASYVLDTGHEINNPNTGNRELSSFFSNYKILFLIAIIVIAGTIVAEEYNKGTIKNLLVVPYKRSTILLAKLITVILMTIITFIIFLLAQILISGILYDFKTMADPVVFYSIRTESLQSFNLFYYIFREFLFSLPLILVYAVFSFAVSTLTTSSTTAITLGIISTFATDIVNQLIVFSEKTWVKYIPTINWDWNALISEEYYLIKIVDPKIAIPMTILTFLVLLIPTFIVFKKRDIKNI